MVVVKSPPVPFSITSCCLASWSFIQRWWCIAEQYTSSACSTIGRPVPPPGWRSDRMRWWRPLDQLTPLAQACPCPASPTERSRPYDPLSHPDSSQLVIIISYTWIHEYTSKFILLQFPYFQFAQDCGALFTSWCKSWNSWLKPINSNGQ